jgi:hypothetical protein
MGTPSDAYVERGPHLCDRHDGVVVEPRERPGREQRIVVGRAQDRDAGAGGHPQRSDDGRQAGRDLRKEFVDACLLERAPPEPEAPQQVVRADLERDERDVPALEHRDRLVELCALGVRAATLGTVDRPGALAGAPQLDESQIRQSLLLELEDLLGIAAVGVAVRLIAGRE